MTNKENLTKISLVVGIILSVTLIINTSLSAYVLYTSSFQASMGDAGESLEVAINADTGHPSPLGVLWNEIKDWTSSYMVGGVSRVNATAGITVSVTGSNVASTAYVDYYIEARETNSQGSPYRFLEGTNTPVSVGGASLDLSNRTTIESHLAAMGLSTTESWTIDYYVYVKAEATGAVSGETLTSEIEPVKFDTVEYTYGSVVSDTFEVNGAVVDGYARDSASTWTNDAVTLFIGDYSSSNYDSHAGVIFQGVIPAGASISEATIKLYAAAAEAASITVKISGELDSTPSAITSYSDFGTRQRTTEYVDWQPSTWASGSVYYTPDITDIVQEIVDEGETTALGFFLEDVADGYNGADNLRRMHSYEAGTGTRAALDVTYVSYSASWYAIPPLSVISLPISMDLAAVLSVIIAALVVAKVKMEEKKK